MLLRGEAEAIQYAASAARKVLLSAHGALLDCRVANAPRNDGIQERLVLAITVAKILKNSTEEYMASNLVELAKIIFEQAEEKALHVDDVASRALAIQPSLGDDCKILARKFSAALSQNMNTKNPIFQHVKNKKSRNKEGKYRDKRGFYALRPIKQNLSRINDTISSIEEGDARYIGKAGEYAVASELMFFGFNATILPVDDGMDVVAAKNNKYFHLQIKSSVSRKTGDFSFPLKRHIFGSNNSSQDFYIFVMRNFERNKWLTNYAIFPSNEIDRMLFDGTITDKDRLSVKITCDRGKYFIGRHKKVDITWNINNFSLIR